jgi:HAD superfamily hydrolase (TIGR01490 family)
VKKASTLAITDISSYHLRFAVQEHAMALALFDLDNTLLAGDSDYLWGVFLVDKGLVDGELYKTANERFYKQYAEGLLDIHEFLNFALSPLARIELEVLQTLHQEFMQTRIREIMTQTGQNKVDEHKAKGDTTLIITATNRFVTQPIAAAFGVDDLIATEPEMQNGRYTGRVAGTPSFQQGKIKRLQAWMESHDQNLADSWFYSDSHNDLPLLEQVSHPVAVDPDQKLQQIAEQRGWPIISFRD